MRCAALCLALLAAPAVAQDYSHVCATPANYQGDAKYDPANVACDTMMGYYTSSGSDLAGKDFSSAFSCSAEAGNVKNAVNSVASYCCGTGDAASQRSACWVDHSYLCATPANYQGGAMYDPAGSTANTCDTIMDYVTAASSGEPLAGKDFSSAFSCPAETYDVKYSVNVFASYCCGTGVSACWADYSHVCTDPSSWTPSKIAQDDGTTCIQLMDYYTQAGQALEGDDFSSASTAAASCTGPTAPGQHPRAVVVDHIGGTLQCCSSGNSVCFGTVDSATLGGRVASAVGAVSVFAVLSGFH
jgi:hypothetical protein